MTAGLASVLLAAAGSAAKADDETTAGALTYFAAGILMVDAGASVANGWALAAGRPNRLNGYVGVVAGVISLGHGRSRSRTDRRPGAAGRFRHRDGCGGNGAPRAWYSERSAIAAEERQHEPTERTVDTAGPRQDGSPGRRDRSGRETRLLESPTSSAATSITSPHPPGCQTVMGSRVFSDSPETNPRLDPPLSIAW